MKLLIINIVLLTIHCISVTPIISNTAIHQPINGQKGMVSSQETLATNIGIDILKQGGNAIDAAVSMGFALAVTLPQAGNLGGGGFMIIHLSKENKTIALDFRETAPLLATKNMFLDKHIREESWNNAE